MHEPVYYLYEGIILDTAHGKQYLFQTIMRLADILNTSTIPYSVIGTIALNQYSDDPRNTSGFDILIAEDDKFKMDALLKSHGFISHFEERELIENNVIHTYIDPTVPPVIFDSEKRFPEVKVLYKTKSKFALNLAFQSSQKVTMFGASFNILSPEFLLWVYAQAGFSKSTADASTLIRSREIDFGKLSEYMSLAKDEEAIEELVRFIEAVERDKAILKLYKSQRITHKTVLR